MGTSKAARLQAGTDYARDAASCGQRQSMGRRSIDRTAVKGRFSTRVDPNSMNGIGIDGGPKTPAGTRHFLREAGCRL
ncbi:hypothetical protein BCEP4_680059 [Burkholderia cepacia]|nr:hypothetical protein BCEP4_680059 [Burkholderia cepacia]